MGLGKDDDEPSPFAPLVSTASAIDYAALEIRCIEQMRADLIERAKIPSGFLSKPAYGTSLINITPDKKLDVTGDFWGLDRAIAIPPPQLGISMDALKYVMDEHTLTIKAEASLKYTQQAHDFILITNPPPRIAPRIGRRDWTAANPWPKDDSE